ncbi:MAG: 50S ribosome-binding GTPase [Bacilli bacterium]|nr:50S ribosome-binding GTPase [Bacilli bacterium]
MNKKCNGCGVSLQEDNITLEGYTTSIDNDLCQRCFRIKNYGEYQTVAKSNDEYIPILRSINDTKDLVIQVVDLLNIDKDLSEIRNYINNKILLVLNKRDVLPKSVKDEKIIEYFKNLGLNYEDIVVISTLKNYNIDLLLRTIKKYQTSKRVYIVGHTNVGKSSLINKLLKNYSNNPTELTISPLPSTTLDKIEIELSETLTLIDTPGLVDRKNITNYIDEKTLKKINPKKEIKPKTFQIKPNQSIIIDDIMRIDYLEGERNSFTIYMANPLKIKKISLQNDRLKTLSKTNYDVKFREDIVVNGLGWIKIVEKGKLDIYIDKNAETYIRKSII